MLKCAVCGCSEFYKTSGYFFCTTCQTQSQDMGEEMELELPIGNTTKLRKGRKIHRAKSDRADEELGWTSWELYNFVLIGLTNEIIQLGVSPDVKVTVLQLWARYLGKLEIAFVSVKKKLMPKLARRYKKGDADIIYGKTLSQKRVRKRGKTSSTLADSTASTNGGISSRELIRNKKLMITADYDRFVRSQASSEGDVLGTFDQSVCSTRSSAGQSCASTRIQFNSSAKEETRRVKDMAKKVPRHKRNKYKQSYVTTRYKTGPELITPTKLWAILYLALRIHNQDIHLGDMIRYGREGHLSYYRLDHLVPAEVALTRSDMNFLSRAMDITHKGMRRIIGRMAKFLGVTGIICPDLLSLVNRYCTELALPKGISSYAERLVSLSVPKMRFDKRFCIPNYEGRAMAFIIVVLKTLLGLDGITENEISNVADKINSAIIMQCQCKNSSIPCILVHGDVGHFHDALIIEKTTSCKNAAYTGYQSLLSGASSVQAVESALWWLECDEFFNCGYGSVLNSIGDVQMDASIVDGFRSECGSVAAISDVEHPISLARYVLDHFPNSIVVGEGARKLTAKLNWLSKGNMTAPTAAYLTCDKSKEMASSVINLSVGDDESSSQVLESSGSTVGCIAYDGYAIAAGVTSGGSNRKIVGSVGDSSILGCGTYANRNLACSLTGHGESIMKLGLSRVIASDIEKGCSLRRALKRNLDYMSTRCVDRHFGGIVFKRSGEWDVYFTWHKMPYAVITNDCVTFGATLDERNVENAISDEGICDTKLFSFREWQKYVECRKAILINAHCPTKLKYNPNVPDVNSLYMKFFESVDSKADRGEPEIIMHKHLIPRDLVYALKQCIGNVSGSDLPLNKVNTFSPTLTPNHSYLQQLLQHPLYDLPSMLQSDFSSAKSGYLTRSESVYKLALQYGIQLASVESNLHFLEKTVTLFEQAKIASMKELKSDDAIEDFMEEDAKCVERKEDFIDYLHKKIPCHLKIDGKKIKCYDDIRVTASTDVCAREKGTFASSEFIFGETLPDGKLSIPGESADESEASSLIKFCKAYNTNLSSTEKKAIFQHLNWSKKRKRRKLVRNVHGKFVKPYPSDGDSSAEEIDTISANTCKIENILPEIPDNSNSSINAPMEDKVLRLFKPFQDYWMYHCNFSRVKPKNFDLLEKMLPRSFRWLLNESASVVEMSTEDMYEEVCLVEGYYAYVSERSKIHSSENYNNRAHINAIFKKW